MTLNDLEPRYDGYFASFQRVVNVWNSLPAERTNFSSLNSFRLSLSNVDFSKFLIID